ncbi:MAG: NAD(P)H-dependent oxidoreductase [Candidatus Omnitrophica bacterium]|nr:NAD(P)H-dependent oxidoreductase [Candidatus Omnitrophota bacterium]
MKVAIIYYSYSGNTRLVAQVLGEYLREEYAVEFIELTALDEPSSFLGQCRRAFSHTKAKIAPVVFDLVGYDLICFGTPVWAFGPAPAINAYLDQCFGATDKGAILFSTYGSGTGNERCLKLMQDLLINKGVKSFSQFSIQQSKVKDKEFVLSKIKEII